MNTAASPQPVEDLQGDRRWLSLHERFLTEAKEKEPEVLFVGDSLFQQLEQNEIWKKMFEPLHCLNFSIGGDQTQNVLWRILHGELESMKPKVIILLVGTNNHDNTADEVAEGILEITKTIHQKQSETQIIVMGIPPRGRNPNPLREKIRIINKILAEKLPKLLNANFFPVDVNLFVSPFDASISHRDMYDYLHLTTQGYQKLFEPLWEEVQELLQTFVKVEGTCSDAELLSS